MILKEYKYTGRTWAVPVFKNIPVTDIPANESIELFKPEYNYSIIKSLTIINLSATTATVYIYDKDINIAIYTIPANSSITISDFVITKSLIVRGNQNIRVFGVMQDFVIPESIDWRSKIQ